MKWWLWESREGRRKSVAAIARRIWNNKLLKFLSLEVLCVGDTNSDKLVRELVDPELIRLHTNWLIV